MTGNFTRRNRPVVTAYTRTDNLGMINSARRDRRPRRGTRHVTGVAVVGRRDMIGHLARNECAVVTTDTATDNLRMIHRSCGHGHPVSRESLMACITKIRGIDVARAFTRRVNTIVTGDTAIGRKIGVIDRCRQPACHNMAQTTVFVRLHMIRILARGLHAVVAIHALSRCFVVIEIDCWNSPTIDVVARFTQIRGGEMTGTFTRGGHVIMTGHTALPAKDTVIEPYTRSGGGRFKSEGGVTDVTGICDGNVIRGNTNREDAVVAGITLFRQFVKHTADMTGLTVNCAVRPFQGKSGR